MPYSHTMAVWGALLRPQVTDLTTFASILGTHAVLHTAWGWRGWGPWLPPNLGGFGLVEGCRHDSIVRS